MGLKIQKYVGGLRPADFVGKQIMFEIVDIKENPRKGSAGGDYMQYTLSLLGATKDTVGDFQIQYLFDRDLGKLIDLYGEDTDTWKGKRILISGRPEGQYFRWELCPAA